MNYVIKNKLVGAKEVAIKSGYSINNPNGAVDRHCEYEVLYVEGRNRRMIDLNNAIRLVLAGKLSDKEKLNIIEELINLL